MLLQLRAKKNTTFASNFPFRVSKEQKLDNYLIPGIVTSMFLWGLSWPSNKVLAGFCSAINFTVYRYIVVVLTMLILLPLTKTSYKISKKGIVDFVTSGLLLALYSYFLFVGLRKGTAGAGGVLVTIMNPIIAYIMVSISKKRKPSQKEFLGLGLGLVAGLILLKVWEKDSVLSNGGNLYFLAAATIWSLMSLFTAKGSRYGSSLTFSLWQYLVTLLCLLPFTDFAEMGRAIHITNHLFWLNLIFASSIVTAIATTVFFFTTTRLGAERASTFIFLVPFAAAISSRVLLEEVIHWNTIVGGLIGITAVYIMNKKKKALH